MTISETIKVQRKIHNLTQQQLAEKINISRQSISKWESGESLPSFSNVMSLSRTLNISLDELIKDDPKLISEIEHPKRSQTLTSIVFKGIVLGIIWLSLLYIFGVTNSHIVIWLSVPSTLTFLGLCFTVNWNKLNLALDKKAKTWVVLWISFIVVPIAISIVTGFIHGMKS